MRIGNNYGVIVAGIVQIDDGHVGLDNFDVTV